MEWISKIADSIEGVLKTVRKPAQPVPPPLLSAEIKQHSGLSAMALTSAIISRLPEIGIDTSANEDGSQQQILALVRIIAEELVKEVQENAVVDIVVDPFQIPVTATGGNAGGPVQVIGYNTPYASIRGIVR